MRKTLAFVIVLGLWAFWSAAPALKAGPQQESSDLFNQKNYTYEPAGRRDPFKSLLGGKEIKEKPAAGAMTQLSIDDISLTGIVKSKEKLTAIISGPHGFPHFIKTGDRLADGYVLSIQETQVVFRKTSDRGIPLMRANDVIKEINPEER
ncbi:MAG: hypothetical protein PHX45_04745 [Acidobacteriota bacterium]|nr:hypothetical protein [Acidobacteriota bacterium]